MAALFNHVKCKENHILETTKIRQLKSLFFKFGENSGLAPNTIAQGDSQSQVTQSNDQNFDDFNNSLHYFITRTVHIT